MPEPTGAQGHVDVLLTNVTVARTPSGPARKRKRKAPIPGMTMKAAELPVEGFAVIGDPDDASTWRHPLWKDDQGTISQGRLHAAMGALRKMDAATFAQAAPRVAKAFEGLYPGRQLPAWLGVSEPSDLGHGLLVPYATAKAMQLSEAAAAALDRVAKADLSPADGPGRLLDAVGQMSADEVVPCMIGFGLPPDIAASLAFDSADGVIVQAPEDLHVTLAYVRIPAGRMGTAMTLIASAMRAACSTAPFSAEITGIGMFIPDDDDDEAPLAPGEDDGDADSDGPWFTAVALIDSVDLSDLRADLIDQLNGQGLPVDDYTHGFVPHVTLAVAQDPDALKALPLPDKQSWTVDSFCVAIGGEIAHFPLIGGWAEPDDDDGPSYVAMAASDEAKRYTFAPLYVPNRLDTHKEWITREQLQETQWDYVRCGDRSVNLQHLPGTVAGEWVDLVCLPFEVTCDLFTVDGVAKSVTVPADTVWMGTVWTEAGWDLVKRGEVQGMSLEGFALYDVASPT